MNNTFYFRGIDGKEVLKLVIATREKIYLASSMTQFKLLDVSNKFYDSIDEKQKLLLLPDTEYQLQIISNFAKQGYVIFKAEQVEILGVGE